MLQSPSPQRSRGTEWIKLAWVLIVSAALCSRMRSGICILPGLGSNCQCTSRPCFGRLCVTILRNPTPPWRLNALAAVEAKGVAGESSFRHGWPNLLGAWCGHTAGMFVALPYNALNLLLFALVGERTCTPQDGSVAFATGFGHTLDASMFHNV